MPKGEDKYVFDLHFISVISMLEDAYQQVKDQMGPCSIACAMCPLGNGTVAEAATTLRQYLDTYQVAVWASSIPGGSEINFTDLNTALDWIHTYTRCLGCGEGGGPPDCPIRTCARERGHELCSACEDLDECTNFEWLGDHASERLKATLTSLKGTSKQEALTAIIKGLESSP